MDSIHKNITKQEHPDIKFITAHVGIKKPKRSHSTDAGFDLCAAKGDLVWVGNVTVIDTGIMVEIPRGYVGLLTIRSGLAAKQGLMVVNSPGIIDSGYRGHLQVILTKIGNDEKERYRIEEGDRIAQLVVVPCNTAAYNAHSLVDSDRGDGGLGSTGAK